MRDLPVAAAMLLACTLAWDAAAGFGGWAGLRSTRLRPAISLALAILHLGLCATLAATLGARPAALLLGFAASLPLHLVCAILLQRSRTPQQWITPGAWERHRATAVDIPMGETSLPALFFEPEGDCVGGVVVVHGAGAHKTYFSWPMTHVLIEAGFAVCAIDLDGHGDNRRVLDFPSVLDNIHAAVGWLRRRTAWTSVVGISLGGCIAARAAAEGLDLDALALLEAPAAVELTPKVLRHERMTLARAATWSLHRYAGTLPLARAWRTRPVHARISTIELIARLDLLDSVPQLRCPLWLCYGSSDLIVPLAQAKQLAAVAPSGTSLLVVPGATHLSLALDRRALRGLAAWLTHVRHSKGSQAAVTEQDTITQT